MKLSDDKSNGPCTWDGEIWAKTVTNHIMGTPALASLFFE